MVLSGLASLRLVDLNQVQSSFRSCLERLASLRLVDLNFFEVSEALACQV